MASVFLRLYKHLQICLADFKYIVFKNQRNTITYILFVGFCGITTKTLSKHKKDVIKIEKKDKSILNTQKNLTIIIIIVRTQRCST